MPWLKQIKVFCIVKMTSIELISFIFKGLVAVLLYHDGRRCLLSAIRTLLQAREGLTWTLELDVEISDLIRSITKQMLDEGITLFVRTRS